MFFGTYYFRNEQRGILHAPDRGITDYSLHTIKRNLRSFGKVLSLMRIGEIAFFWEPIFCLFCYS